MKNPSAFFDKLRKVTGALNQEQVNIVNHILDTCEVRKHPVGWVAYELATAWHEAHFIPQDEVGKGRGRPYAKAGKYGQPQYGRGLVQLTWDRNYEWADKRLKLGGELLKDFDLAKRPDISTRILVIGMEEGAFTGVGLKKYIVDVGTHAAFVRCRRIINGTDCDEKIALYADQIQDGLIGGGW